MMRSERLGPQPDLKQSAEAEAAVQRVRSALFGPFIESPTPWIDALRLLAVLPTALVAVALWFGLAGQFAALPFLCVPEVAATVGSAVGGAFGGLFAVLWSGMMAPCHKQLIARFVALLLAAALALAFLCGWVAWMWLSIAWGGGLGAGLLVGVVIGTPAMLHCSLDGRWRSGPFP